MDQKYALSPHPTYVEKNKYYCRAANAMMPADLWFCESCPLLGGATQGDQQGLAECYYYDSRAGAAINYCFPQEIKRHINREILMDRTGEFPRHRDDGFVNSALRFAANAHKGQYRKGTKIPYFMHALEASSIARELTDDETVIAAAALHDVVEDTPCSAEDIEILFGASVRLLVEEESENKREGMPAAQSWRIRKEETLHSLAHASCEAKIITLGDKLSNMRQMKRDHDTLGNEMWKKFNQTDKTQQEWYYRSIGELLADQLGNTRFFEEDVFRQG